MKVGFLITQLLRNLLALSNVAGEAYRAEQFAIEFHRRLVRFKPLAHAIAVNDLFFDALFLTRGEHRLVIGPVAFC